MTSGLTIALDAMGGDVGPGIVIPGAELAAIRHPTYRFLLFGDQAILAPLLERHPKLKARAEIRHTEVAVSMTEKPSQALRRPAESCSSRVPWQPISFPGIQGNWWREPATPIPRPEPC